MRYHLRFGAKDCLLEDESCKNVWDGCKCGEPGGRETGKNSSAVLKRGTRILQLVGNMGWERHSTLFNNWIRDLKEIKESKVTPQWQIQVAKWWLWMNRYEKSGKARDLKGQVCLALMRVEFEFTVRRSHETDGLKYQEESSEVCPGSQEETVDHQWKISSHKV